MDCPEKDEVEWRRENTHAVFKQYGFIDVLTRLEMYGWFDRTHTQRDHD